MNTGPQQPGADRRREDEQYSSPAGFAELAARFEAVRQLPAAERTAALAAHEQQDPELASELRRLLAQHDDDPDELAGPDRMFAAEALDAALRDAAHEGAEPERLGPYRVVRTLGRGGMGRVYLAEHEDPDLRRQVAIKVLLRARHDPDLVRRFRTERRILGALQHPNIAALYDGGATEDGTPFVVMEFVDGVDLLRHCDVHELSLDARLRLFVKVCRAVAHAHRSLVVHRDLKPSNVLVTASASGEPKLLDFGIAKLLDDPAGDALTRTGSMLLTPEYSSPEQVRGEAVTTATDVYALGALLYELLCGARAQRLATGATTELLQIVCERTPPPPSVVARRQVGVEVDDQLTHRRWWRRLEGDLDTIVATAMHKEPERRFASASALADDLERHLRGLPVTARPDTLRYRARKFVARHRLPVAALALAVAVLVVFAVVTARDNAVIERQLATIREQNEQIRSERDTAQNQTAVARRVVAFLASLYDMAAPDPDRSETLRARELLDRGARRIARELEALPAQRAPLQLAMGRAYLSLGLFDDADPLLSAAERTFGEIAADGYAHREAQFVLAGLRMNQARYDDGDRLLRRSWQQVTRGQRLSLSTQAARRSALATWLRARGSYDDALELIASARALVADEVVEPKVADDFDVAEAAIRSDRGEFVRAGALLREAVARAEARDGENHPRHAKLYRELGQLELQRSDLDAARAALRRALDIDRRWTGEQHPDVDADLFAVAMVEIDRGEWREAADALREVLERDVRRLGSEHPTTALTRGQLAMVTGRLGEVQAAVEMFEQVLALQRRRLPADHPEIATTLANFATLYKRDGEYERALPLYREALQIRARIYPPEHPTVLTARQQLAVLELDRGNAPAAEEQFRTLLKLRREVRGDHPETAGSLLSLATCIARQRRPAESVPLFEEATAMFRSTLPEGHPTIAHALLGHGLALLRLDRAGDAEPLLREAENLRQQAFGPEHFETLYARFCRVRALVQAQRFVEARRLSEEALPRMQAGFPDNRLTRETAKLLQSLPR